MTNLELLELIHTRMAAGRQRDTPIVASLGSLVPLLRAYHDARTPPPLEQLPNVDMDAVADRLIAATRALTAWLGAEVPS